MPTSEPNQEPKPATWATPVSRLKITDLPSEAINLNVNGRQLTGPLQGFGQLWQKTYRVSLDDVQVMPAEVIQVWKQNFSSFWPKGNHFYGSITGINPGDVALLNLAGPGGMTGPGGGPLISTGIMVIYADDESFSFMTPQGHMFAGMITFSSFENLGTTMIQVQALIRASDPIFELTFRLGIGGRTEDEFWRLTLESLAAHYNVRGTVKETVVCVDPKVQWHEARNIWQNAALRTGLYWMLSPFRWARNRISNHQAH